MESNTEACNFDSDDVHDDGGGVGGGVQHRSLYCDVDADDVHDGGGGGVDQVFFVGVISQRHTIRIVRRKLILLLNADYNILISHPLAENAILTSSASQ